MAAGLEREPFAKYFAQGMIRMDGTKMSKSKGNLIAPSQYYATVGADALRLFHLGVGPPADDFDWTDQTDEVIDGCGRFLDRLWRLLTADARTRRGSPPRSHSPRPMWRPGELLTGSSKRSPQSSIGGRTTPRWPTCAST